MILARRTILSQPSDELVVQKAFFKPATLAIGGVKFSVNSLAFIDLLIWSTF